MALACLGAERVESPGAAGGQKITKEFYPDGTLKTITRLYPDGRVLGTQYHSTNGTPTHADYYDNEKRVRRTLLYRPDGTAHTSQEFDEQHRPTTETRLDRKGQATGVSFHLQRGRVIVRAPASWQVISHKLDASQDVVGFQIPNPADKGTPDSANLGVFSYDLSQTTNVTALAEARRKSEKTLAKPSDSGGWSIYTFSDKQGDTPYEIRDAYRTLGQQYALHVRLAFPKLRKTTREWRRALEDDFKSLLGTTELSRIP